VVFEPALKVTKRCAIEACGMGRAIKIVFEFDTPWWRKDGWNGSMFCDGPLQQLWDGTIGEAPILSAYICGEQAKEWLAKPEPVREALQHLAKIAPEASDHFVRGWVHDWCNDPYSRGAYSNLPPGYVLHFMQHISTPEQRVHFAGEHTAMWTGFIEGAIESAERVVPEVLDGNAL
jgi:monoamine oxidase